MKPKIDTTRPHAARMYDYYLGGKDNFQADRETAQQAMASWPAVRTAVRENRAFMGRAVRYLVAEAGIRQFLDIGTGLPSANNVHEVAQDVAPSCRVVYVDNDPIVLAHARALLTSSPRADRLHPGGPARTRRDPGPPGDAGDAGLHRAGGADAGRRCCTSCPTTRPAGDHARRCLTRCRPAATWWPRTSRPSTITRESWAGNAPTRRRGCPPSPASSTTSPASRSVAWTWWTLGWSWCRSGGPTPAGLRPLPSEVNWYGGVARKP